MSDGINRKFNVAICVGDLQAAKGLLGGLCADLNYFDINVHIFNGYSLDYSGEPHDIGQASIFTLPNYELLDALIVAPFFLSASQDIIDSVINSAKDAGVPVLTIGAEYEGCYSVLCDYTAQVERICEHFINHHNCTEINFISGTKGHPVAEARLAGYKRAMEKSGLGYDPGRVYYGDFWDMPTIKAVNDMLSDGKPLPEAIVCANDVMALTVISRLSELGYKVPEDVLVSGMDCIPEAEEYITTVRLMGEDTGHFAATVMNDILNGKEVDNPAYVDPGIRFGCSCGCSPDKTNMSVGKRHALYNDIFDATRHTQTALRLNQEINNSSSFEKAMESIGNAALKIWAKYLWICLCDDFLQNIEIDNIKSADDATGANDDKLHRGCFSPKMQCPIIIRDHKLEKGTAFDTAQMLPNFYESADEAKCVLYSPLHFRDVSIGYIVIDFFPWSNLTYLMNVVAIGIANVLESVRRQSELYAYAKKVDELYITDSLTGLYNRRGFFRLYKEYSQNVTGNKAVISMDLDNLKLINDNYGHKEGDNAITVISDAMKAVFGETGICARFGGDEFVIYGSCTDDEALNDRVEEIKNKISSYNLTSGKPYNVNASIGWCLVPAEQDKNIDYYINAADAKMYTDKEMHKRARSRYGN
ncbi:MAG: GGDEF domain-containing protein [Eubacterium sp.]|nr:GGDEF domain-containing protein [Eubacterium sp.]